MGTEIRKQRLRTLEKEIRDNFESFVRTGNALMTIRDEGLYEEAGYDKWSHYLDKRVGLEFGIEKTQAKRLIQCAEIRPKLPKLNSSPRGGSKPGWTFRAVKEFARMVPQCEAEPRKKDYAAFSKVDAKRVAKAAVKYADGTPVNSSHVRKAIDADLGVSRKPKAQVAAPKIDAKDYLRRKTDTIKGITENITGFLATYWTQLEKDDPQLVKDFATACSDLAELMAE